MIIIHYASINTLFFSSSIVILIREKRRCFSFNLFCRRPAKGLGAEYSREFRRGSRPRSLPASPPARVYFILSVFRSVGNSRGLWSVCDCVLRGCPIMRRSVDVDGLELVLQFRRYGARFALGLPLHQATPASAQVLTEALCKALPVLPVYECILENYKQKNYVRR